MINKTHTTTQRLCSHSQRSYNSPEIFLEVRHKRMKEDCVIILGCMVIISWRSLPRQTNSWCSTSNRQRKHQFHLFNGSKKVCVKVVCYTPKLGLFGLCERTLGFYSKSWFIRWACDNWDSIHGGSHRHEFTCGTQLLKNW